MKAMILAAGLGTRLKPITNNKPKALIEVGGFTLLELTIRYLKKFGVDQIVVNVHHFADQITEYLKKHKGFGIPYTISDESDMLMNTGGAMVHAFEYLKNEEFFILMGVDVLTGLDLGAMIEYHMENKPLVTLAVKERETSRSLLFDNNMQLVGWRNNANDDIKGMNAADATSALGFSVIQIINTEIFDLITESGAFSIIDLYLRLMDTKKILGFRHDSTPWLEFGRIDRLTELPKTEEFIQLTSHL
jgi:NDP-sugar pyrophosphorylase family protein